MDDALDIQIPDIEKSLEKLCNFPKDKKPIKACLFTLIIYVHDLKRIQYYQNLIDNIRNKFPCRIIFIREDNQQGRHLQVEVANVTSGKEGPMVVCDQITITSTQSELARVPYIVIPHIVTDLPIYLLWSQTPFKEQVIFPALKPYASRIIFDSECSQNLHQFSEEMLKNISSLKMDVMDINWALVSNWRDMLGQLFDTPSRLSLLEKCKSLRINYNNIKSEATKSYHPEIRAIYLQGWLASRLNWKYCSSEQLNDLLIICYAKEHPSIVALCAKKDEKLPCGAIISIELETIDGYSIHITRKHSLSQVVVHLSTPEQCELPFTLPLPDVHQGLTFIKELFYHKLGDHYCDMLKTISKMDYANL